MTVFKEIFGKDPEEVWRQFATEIGGNYIEGHYGDSDSVEVEHQHWKIIFDVFTHRVMMNNREYCSDYTRVRAAFTSRDGLQFRIFRKGIGSTIGKLFGAQDLLIGDLVFDKAFIIKGNDEYKIQSLFANEKIRTLLLQQKDFQLHIMDNKNAEAENKLVKESALEYMSEDVVREPEELKVLHSLFMLLLEQLSKIGSAQAAE